MLAKGIDLFARVSFVLIITIPIVWPLNVSQKTMSCFEISIGLQAIVPIIQLYVVIDANLESQFVSP